MSLTGLLGKTVLVTGCRGQVGDKLLRELAGKCRVVATDLRPDPVVPDLVPVDLGSEKDVLALLRDARPDVIINPAAHTAVDKAETDGALAEHLNARVPALLAADAAARGALLVHYSTDYVFDGSGTQPRDETVAPAPLSAYGRTKLEGENAIRASGAAHLLYRTSWVFSDHGVNFVRTMLKLGAERDSLRIVADQVGAPTSAAFLARMTVATVERTLRGEALGGLYHLCCAGEVSWHGFAVEIFRQARARGASLRVATVEPLTSAEYPTPARRPLNSRLDCSRFDRTFGLPRQTWSDALAEVLALVT